MSERETPISIVRIGLATAQAAIGLFSAGTVLYGAHTLFLRYYEREWQGIQIAGVNGCAGEERVVNGDLFDGQTLCNQPENFVPWIEIYKRHWEIAGLYYGVGLLAISVIGLVMFLLQRTRALRAPFGETPAVLSPADSEHLR